MPKANENAAADEGEVQPPICGIVMPISELPPYPAAHWRDVQAIVEEAVAVAGFKAKMVSDDDAIGVIQQRIVQNLYDNEIVVVDVSGRNPNVMFELGMRLAFDRPVVIIKDELTPYNFDTAPIEHLAYRSDLHYQSTITFKATLTEKIRSTAAAGKDPNNSVFLKHFGEFTAKQINKTEVSEYSAIMHELASMRKELRNDRRVIQAPLVSSGDKARSIQFEFPSGTVDTISTIARDISTRYPSASMTIYADSPPRLVVTTSAADTPSLLAYVTAREPDATPSTVAFRP